MQKEKTECTCDIIQTDNRSTDLSFKVIVVGNAGII